MSLPGLGTIDGNQIALKPRDSKYLRLCDTDWSNAPTEEIFAPWEQRRPIDAWPRPDAFVPGTAAPAPSLNSQKEKAVS